MKIIQITPYYPPRVGGVPNCVREISEELSKKGHEVEIFTSDISCEKGKLKSKKNFKIKYLKGFELGHSAIIPSLFPKLMKLPRNSIMHVHIAQAFVPEIVWLVSKIKKIPYVLHLHSDVKSSGKLGFLLPLYKKLFLKKVMNSANEIIVLTKDYKSLIMNKYSVYPSKIHIIPNGVRDEFFVNQKRNDKKGINLLYVGRLSIEKNIPKLIEAISLLKNKVALHIVGDGELKKDLEKLVNKKEITNIIFHGKKEKRELLKFYREASIFLLVSNSEGLPLSLLEAMATETTIIASNIPGTRTVVKNGYNGLLVKPTPKNIAKAIEKLIKNPKLRKKLAENGLKEVKKYSWDKIVEQTEQVYREVLEEHNKKLKQNETNKK